MIEFIYNTEFYLTDEKRFEHWIESIIQSEDKLCGDITYFFCDDPALDKINQEYLNHKDFTDIISFDSTFGNIISGEIFISVDRVKENARIFGVKFDEELLRVMAHGILHFCEYKDAEENDRQEMRSKEDEKIKMFHVEHSTKNERE